MGCGRQDDSAPETSAMSAVSAGITLALILPSYFPHTPEPVSGEGKGGGMKEEGGKTGRNRQTGKHRERRERRYHCTIFEHRGHCEQALPKQRRTSAAGPSYDL